MLRMHAQVLSDIVVLSVGFFCFCFMEGCYRVGVEHRSRFADRWVISAGLAGSCSGGLMVKCVIQYG